MSKVLKYIFLPCALFLVLGHSLLPHNHAEEHQLSYQIVDSGSYSFVEILTLALSSNIGANHFEEYRNGNRFELTEILDLDFIASEINQGEHSYNFLRDFESSIELPNHIQASDHLLIYSPLRAPPIPG